MRLETHPRWRACSRRRACTSRARASRRRARSTSATMHPQPEAPCRPPALQRGLPAARVDLAVLPAVRVCSTSTPRSTRQGRRDAVGPLHRARHRDAQEAARVRRTSRAPAAAPRSSGSSTPSCRTARGVRNSAHAADAIDALESLPTELLKREQQCWNFEPGAAWHGYAAMAPATPWSTRTS